MQDKAAHQFVQYAANVAMKVNAKLGGVNHILRDEDYGKLVVRAKEWKRIVILIGESQCECQSEKSWKRAESFDLWRQRRSSISKSFLSRGFRFLCT